VSVRRVTLDRTVKIRKQSASLILASMAHVFHYQTRLTLVSVTSTSPEFTVKQKLDLAIRIRVKTGAPARVILQALTLIQTPKNPAARILEARSSMKL